MFLSTNQPVAINSTAPATIKAKTAHKRDLNEDSDKPAAFDKVVKRVLGRGFALATAVFVPAQGKRK